MRRATKLSIVALLLYVVTIPMDAATMTTFPDGAQELRIVPYEKDESAGIAIATIAVKARTITAPISFLMSMRRFSLHWP